MLQKSVSKMLVFFRNCFFATLCAAAVVAAVVSTVVLVVNQPPAQVFSRLLKGCCETSYSSSCLLCAHRYTCGGMGLRNLSLSDSIYALALTLCAYL